MRRRSERVRRRGVLQSIALPLFCALASCTGGIGQPKLYCSDEAINLGVLDSSRGNPFSIPIENRGKAPLQIAGVSSSCDCTIVDPPGEIRQGAHGLLRGQVHVRPGPGSSEIRIASNDPDGKHILRLRWSGRGVPALVPSSVYLRCRRGKTIETDVEICYPSGPRLELLQTSGLPSGWSVVLVGNSPNAVQADPFLSGASAIGKAVVRLKAVAPPAQGASNLLALVAVRYGLERYELKLPVKIDVDDGIGAVPRNLLFTSDSLGRLLGLERRIVLQPVGRDDQLEVVRKPSYLEVTWDRETPTTAPRKPRSVVMRARITAPPPSKFGRAEVEVRASSGGRVVIPILVSYDS